MSKGPTDRFLLCRCDGKEQRLEWRAQRRSNKTPHISVQAQAAALPSSTGVKKVLQMSRNAGNARALRIGGSSVIVTSLPP